MIHENPRVRAREGIVQNFFGGRGAVFRLPTTQAGPEG